MNPRVPGIVLNATLASALALAASLACAQPQFGNPSPTAGSKTSQQANAAADTAMYQPVEYANKNKKGPALIVIPGEVKSNNATFTQKFTANNIADYAELELSMRSRPGVRASSARASRPRPGPPGCSNPSRAARRPRPPAR